MTERPSAENDALRELVEAGMTYAEAEAALCDHPSKVWLDDETGWRCYDCNFVIGHQECTDHDAVPVVRGWLTYPDGSMTGIERWVKHADGDWVSLDSSRRTSRDIHMDLGAGVNAPDVPTALPGSGAKGSGSAPAPASTCLTCGCEWSRHNGWGCAECPCEQVPNRAEVSS